MTNQDELRIQRVRERAHRLWEESGHTGMPEEHWQRAEREIDREDSLRPPEPPQATG